MLRAPRAVLAPAQLRGIELGAFASAQPRCALALTTAYWCNANAPNPNRHARSSARRFSTTSVSSRASPTTPPRASASYLRPQRRRKPYR
eukprot:2341983-Prymnesium_polylepis.1